MKTAKTPNSKRSLVLLLGFIPLAGGLFLWAQNAVPLNDNRFISIANAADTKKGKAAPPAIVWKAATKAQQTLAEGVIGAQLAAFASNDWKKAVEYQSAGLKKNFASPVQFGAMIKQNYPQFADCKRMKFGKATVSGDELEMLVELIGRDGVSTSAIYLLTKEKGLYKVSGVGGGAVAAEDKSKPA